MIKFIDNALAGLARWVEHRSVDAKTLSTGGVQEAANG